MNTIKKDFKDIINNSKLVKEYKREGVEDNDLNEMIDELIKELILKMFDEKELRNKRSDIF